MLSWLVTSAVDYLEVGQKIQKVIVEAEVGVIAAVHYTASCECIVVHSSCLSATLIS